MKEADLHRAIMLAASQAGHALWRNNVGQLVDSRGHHVRYGLAVGSSDLIGIGPGGRFASIEVKLPGGRPTADQAAWLDMVRGRGGIAGVAHSVDEALAILGR